VLYGGLCYLALKVARSRRALKVLLTRYASSHGRGAWASARRRVRLALLRPSRVAAGRVRQLLLLLAALAPRGALESAAAADDVVAAAIAWVAEAGTASVLELALLEEAWHCGGLFFASSSSSRAALVAPRWIFGPCAAVRCWDMAWKHTDGRLHYTACGTCKLLRGKLTRHLVRHDFGPRSFGVLFMTKL
jgi:hypothetical protein